MVTAAEEEITITINPEYETFVQPQTPAEYKAMKESIRQSGQHVPATINQNGTIIDGHHRYRACKELDIPLKYEIKHFDNELEELQFIQDVNDKRRHYSEFQRCEQNLRFKSELAKLGRENKILAAREKTGLTKLGKTPINVQEELARAAGVSKGTINKVEHIINSEHYKHNQEFRQACRTEEKSIDKAFNHIKDLEDENKPEDIHLTEWAKRLEGLTDVERFDAFGKKIYGNRQPEKYNHWHYQQTDKRLGLQDHPGKIAGQIPQNFIHRWTKQGDRVVDPFAGGGSTIDACLIMNRSCMAYDIYPRRPDIKQCDITKGFPEEAKGCDAIFLDPPYWNLKAKDYAKYSKESISSLSYPEFMKAMEKLAKDCYDTIKEGGHVGLIIQDFFDDKETWQYLDLPVDCIIIFRKVGFKEVRRIGVPLDPAVKTALDVYRINIKRGELLDINRDLTIFQKKIKEEVK